MRERHEPDQVGKGEDGVEDNEEGGEDCPEELRLNRHGNHSDKIVMKMVIRSSHLVEQTQVWTTTFYQALVKILIKLFKQYDTLEKRMVV